MEGRIKDKSFGFALDVIAFYKHLISENEYILSKQILKSGTSIGANVHEAQAAQSKADFLAKMYIAYKEAVETEYWLQLFDESKITNYDFKKLISSVQEIILILSSITKTTRYSLEKVKK